MELKNVNLNVFNVVIKDLKPFLLFFSKILKIELNKGLQSITKKFRPQQGYEFCPLQCNYGKNKELFFK